MYFPELQRAGGLLEGRGAAGIAAMLLVRFSCSQTSAVTGSGNV